MFADMEGMIRAGSPEARLLDGLDAGRLPEHIAIIMDGNGRWAKNRGKDRIEGHRRGAETARLIVEACARLSIPVLTLYTFSSENWKRPTREVNALMNMLYENLVRKAELLKQHNVRLRMIGDPVRLPARLSRKLKEIETMSKGFSAMTLNMALNYGGRQEILHAVRELIASGAKPEDISHESLRRHLYTGDIPDPDLVIRTSGEQRLSNFLIYQSAYSELVFSQELWPDFRVLPLLEALTEYQSRQRRYGGI